MIMIAFLYLNNFRLNINGSCSPYIVSQARLEGVACETSSLCLCGSEYYTIGGGEGVTRDHNNICLASLASRSAVSQVLAQTWLLATFTVVLTTMPEWMMWVGHGILPQSRLHAHGGCNTDLLKHGRSIYPDSDVCLGEYVTKKFENNNYYPWNNLIKQINTNYILSIIRRRYEQVCKYYQLVICEVLFMFTPTVMMGTTEIRQDFLHCTLHIEVSKQANMNKEIGQ